MARQEKVRVFDRRGNIWAPYILFLQYFMAEIDNLMGFYTLGSRITVKFNIKWVGLEAIQRLNTNLRLLVDGVMIRRGHQLSQGDEIYIHRTPT